VTPDGVGRTTDIRAVQTDIRCQVCNHRCFRLPPTRQHGVHDHGHFSWHRRLHLPRRPRGRSRTWKSTHERGCSAGTHAFSIRATSPCTLNSGDE
jgi:hypothetical protein